MDSVESIWTTVGGVAAALAIIAAVIRASRPLRRVWRRVTHFLDDWNGQDARPGVEARPGVMQRMRELDDGNLHIIDRVTNVESRLRHIENEMHPNGGGSLRDQINAIRDTLAQDRGGKR